MLLRSSLYFKIGLDPSHHEVWEYFKASILTDVINSVDRLEPITRVT